MPKNQLPTTSQVRFLDYFKRRLIKLVEEHPRIWQGREYFGAKRIRCEDIDQSWKEIARTLKTNVKCCQTQWLTLRDGFNRERKKDTVKKYQRKTFKYFDSMQFLIDKNRIVKSSVSAMPALVTQCFKTTDKLTELSSARRKFKLNLIEEVRSHINLWNPRSPSFHDKRLENQSWMVIAKKLNTNVKKCQAIFDILSNAYYKIYKKQEKPKWEYYKSLRFLDIGSLDSDWIAVCSRETAIRPIISKSANDMPILESMQILTSQMGTIQSGCSSQSLDEINFTHSLIKKVHLHRNLWDMSLPSYADDVLKRKSWMQISNELKTSADLCQTTFDVLRDDYFQIYSKQKSKPSWEYYYSLSFLDTVDEQYKTSLVNSVVPISSSVDSTKSVMQIRLCAKPTTEIKIEKPLHTASASCIKRLISLDNFASAVEKSSRLGSFDEDSGRPAIEFIKSEPAEDLDQWPLALIMDHPEPGLKKLLLKEDPF